MNQGLRDTSNRPRQAGLAALNRRFHETFAALRSDARNAVARGEHPVFVRMDDRLFLVNGASRRCVEVVGERYHVLKALAHLAPAVYLTLRSPDARARCDALERELSGFEDAPRDVSLDEVLRASRRLLAMTERGKRPLGHEAVLEYARSVQVAFDRLVKAAAEHEVNALDQAMRELQREIDPARIPHTFYVVCASHQPRYRELTKMFFHRWAQASPGGASDARHRVLYAEGRDDLEQAIDLVATRLANGHLARVFLHSPLDLDQDVLGDATQKALDHHYGPA